MADPTQVEKLAAAWARLRISNNQTMPALVGRLRRVVSILTPPRH